MDIFCINCAMNRGCYRPAIPENLFHSEYQLDKYIKHTTPTSDYNFNSIFTNPSTSVYKDYIVSCVSSGYVQIDERGRLNIVWVASNHAGISYKHGNFFSENDAIKVVFHDNEFKIHGFPIMSSGIIAKKCQICGSPIPY